MIGEVLAEAIAESATRNSGSEHYRVYTKQYDHIDVMSAAYVRTICDEAPRRPSSSW